MLTNLLRKVFAQYGSGQKFADTKRYDPYKSFRFEVEISGDTNFAKFGFQKCSALKVDVDVIDYREGGDSTNVVKTPGLVKYEPITLERGMSEDADMWDWAVKALEKNSGFRASVTIKLKDRDNTVVKKWILSDAWVSSYSTGDFDAMSNSVMLERITIQHEGFAKANV